MDMLHTPLIAVTEGGSSALKSVTIATALLSLLMLVPIHATAVVNVLACEPEWASLAEAIGGDKVKVTSATTPLQDPHRIEARPSLIARARSADLLVCSGLELETGWLPILVQQSGNSRLTAGQPGWFEAGSQVPRIEQPGRLDRSDGDVHPGGNPHVHMDPRNIARLAPLLATRLGEIDPAGKAFYQSRQAEFTARWNAAIQRWEQRAAPLKGLGVVVHHRNMSHLLNWLGLREIGALEPKPGIEPSAAHLSSLLAQLQAQPARMVVRAAYQDARASEWIADRAKIPAVMLPYTVGGTEGAKDLFGLFDDTLERLLAAIK